MLSTVILTIMLQTWISTPTQPPVVIEGSWQTCNGAERIYDRCINGKCTWALHLGPGDEFAVYERDKDPIGDHGHNSADNLLMPFFQVRDSETRRGKRVWEVKDLQLEVEVIAGEMHDNDCENYYVIVRSIQK